VGSVVISVCVFLIKSATDSAREREREREREMHQLFASLFLLPDVKRPAFVINNCHLPSDVSLPRDFSLKRAKTMNVQQRDNVLSYVRS